MSRCETGIAIYVCVYRQMVHALVLFRIITYIYTKYKNFHKNNMVFKTSFPKLTC